MKTKKKLFSLLIFLSFTGVSLQGYADSLIEKDSIPIKKKTLLVYSVGLSGYAGSMFLLNDLWYKDYPRSGFHFFNDNEEWLQMDKVGHMTSAYHVSLWGIDVMRWTGVNKKKAIWVGGLAGPFYMTTIEIFDGFSAGWGASPGDLLANTMGSVLSIGQELLWNEQRICLRWSFHMSPYAKYRPDLLGKTSVERILKDYNGQTYWVSMNINSLFGFSKVPEWLNLALGYSAEGMTGSFRNPEYFNNIPIPKYDRRREFLFSFDVDLNRIHAKSKFLKQFSKTFHFLKIPFPAVIFTGRKIYFNPLYF